MHSVSLGLVKYYIYNRVIMHYLQNEETCQIEVTSVRLSSCVSVPNLVAMFFFNQKINI
jgi:hypothetical protein